VLINVVSPEKAAEDMRDALEKIAMRESTPVS
jgi:galactose-1-phosphate uridylyltransferase